MIGIKICTGERYIKNRHKQQVIWHSNLPKFPTQFKNSAPSSAAHNGGRSDLSRVPEGEL